MPGPYSKGNIKVVTRKYHVYVDCDNISGYQIAPKCTYSHYRCIEVSFTTKFINAIRSENLESDDVSIMFDTDIRRRVEKLAQRQFAPLLEQMPTDKLNWYWTRDIDIFTLTCELKLPTAESPDLVYDLFCINLVEDAYKAQLFEDIPAHLKSKHNLEM